MALPRQPGPAFRAGQHGMDDRMSLVRRAPGRQTQVFRQGLRTEALHHLAQAHVHAVENRVYPPGRVRIQHILSGAERHEAEAVAQVGQFEDEGRAEGPQFRIDGVHGVVEVAALQHHAHAGLHLIQITLARVAARKFGIVQGQPEPGPGGAGHAALQTGGQGPHGQDARGVHQGAVEQGTVVQTVIGAEAGGQKVLGQTLPGRVPGRAPFQQGPVTPGQGRDAQGKTLSGFRPVFCRQRGPLMGGSEQGVQSGALCRAHPIAPAGSCRGSPARPAAWCGWMPGCPRPCWPCPSGSGGRPWPLR